MHKWFRVRVLKRSTNLRHKRCLCETEIFASSLTFFFSSSHTEYKFSTINHNSHKTLNTNNSRRIATRNSERKSFVENVAVSTVQRPRARRDYQGQARLYGLYSRTTVPSYCCTTARNASWNRVGSHDFAFPFPAQNRCNSTRRCFLLTTAVFTLSRSPNFTTTTG